MKIAVKIIAVLAAAIGLMAVFAGSRVLLGLYDPGYQYFTSLVSYNVIMGTVSAFAGILIWTRNRKALLISFVILGAHIIVLLLLKTVFGDVISEHSVNAMTFRVSVWIVLTAGLSIIKAKGK
ncbi:MAG: hypothetical protein GXO87_09780 [Chlorobi bacterium]|nr:hypothetical protein [Chlorobiota bacterium]